MITNNLTSGPNVTDEQRWRRTEKAASRLRQFALDVQDTLASYVTTRDGCPPAWREEVSISPAELINRLNYVLITQRQHELDMAAAKANNNNTGAPAQPSQLQPPPQINDEQRAQRKSERLRDMCKRLRETHRSCHDQLNQKDTDLAQIQQQLANALSEVEQARQEMASESQSEQPSSQSEGGAGGVAGSPKDNASLAVLQMWQTGTQQLEQQTLKLQRTHAEERAQWKQSRDRLAMQMCGTLTELGNTKKEQARLAVSLEEANGRVVELQKVNEQSVAALVTVRRQSTVESIPTSTAASPRSLSLSERSSKQTIKTNSVRQEPASPVPRSVSRKSSDENSTWSVAPNGLNVMPSLPMQRNVVPLSKRFNKNSKAAAAKPSISASKDNGECYGTCERRDLSTAISSMVDGIYELMEKDAVLFGDADKVKDFELMLWQFQKKVKDLLRTNDADSPSCVTTPEDNDDESTIKETTSKQEKKK